MSTIHLFPSAGDPGSHTWSGHGLASRKHLLHRVKDKCVPLHGAGLEKHEKQRSLVPSILDEITGASILSGVLALGISIWSYFLTPSATRSLIAFFQHPCRCIWIPDVVLHFWSHLDEHAQIYFCFFCNFLYSLQHILLQSLLQRQELVTYSFAMLL